MHCCCSWRLLAVGEFKGKKENCSYNYVVMHHTERVWASLQSHCEWWMQFSIAHISSSNHQSLTCCWDFWWWSKCAQFFFAGCDSKNDLYKSIQTVCSYVFILSIELELSSSSSSSSSLKSNPLFPWAHLLHSIDIRIHPLNGCSGLVTHLPSSARRYTVAYRHHHTLSCAAVKTILKRRTDGHYGPWADGTMGRRWVSKERKKEEEDIYSRPLIYRGGDYTTVAISIIPFTTWWCCISPLYSVGKFKIKKKKEENITPNFECVKATTTMSVSVCLSVCVCEVLY